MSMFTLIYMVYALLKEAFLQVCVWAEVLGP